MIYPQNFEQKIGFDSIRQLLKEKCLSTLGEERIYDMTFSESYDEINRRLEEITEFIRIIQVMRPSEEILGSEWESMRKQTNPSISRDVLTVRRWLLTACAGVLLTR